jgi:hypothetical protein
MLWAIGLVSAFGAGWCARVMLFERNRELDMTEIANQMRQDFERDYYANLKRQSKSQPINDKDKDAGHY